MSIALRFHRSRTRRGAGAVAGGAGTARAQDAAVIAEVDRAMEAYRLDGHIPGMVWGIVKDGRLVHVKGAGMQDPEAKRPVGRTRCSALPR